MYLEEKIQDLSDQVFAWKLRCDCNTTNLIYQTKLIKKLTDQLEFQNAALTHLLKNKGY